MDSQSTSTAEFQEAELQARLSHPIHPTLSASREVSLQLINKPPGSSCRICWAEEDEAIGGQLLAPCSCSGTSRYVHERCLSEWMQHVSARKSPYHARRCDICRKRYTLPAHLAIHESVPQLISRISNDAWQRALRSPAGPAFQATTTSVCIYSVLSGMWGAACGVLDVPRVLVAARNDPGALRVLAPRFAAAALLEPMFFHHDWGFHAETVMFYAGGWLLDAAARLAESNVLLGLPPHLQLFAASALMIPKSIGFAFQALHLFLMGFFAGGCAGFMHGALDCAAAPFHFLATLAKGAAGALGVLACILTKAGRSAESAASALNRLSPTSPIG